MRSQPPLSWAFVTLCLVLLHVGTCRAVGRHAEQIHVAYTEDVTRLVVTWSTSEQCHTLVRYGRDTPDKQNSGNATVFAQGTDDQHVQYIHRAYMTDLEPGTPYVYQVSGCSRVNISDEWSDVFSVTSMLSGTDWSPRVAVYGDLGYMNARSVPFLIKDMEAGMYDAIVHVGDLAYDMDSGQGWIGDLFMRMMQPLAAQLPYMTCPGNHENAGNFSNYKNRFSMPGGTEGMYYSFDMGPVHWIAVSTEYFYYTNYGYEQLQSQYNWLKADLEAATSAAARALRPWVVLFGHRPMYCTNDDSDWCTSTRDPLRVGLPDHDVPGLEPLLMEYGVDLAIWAHEHSYERLWPVYNFTVYNGTQEEPYTNPGAPVHITTGSAGCDENHDHFQNDKPAWSAFRNNDYGYTRMTFHNGTHMHLEQVSQDKRGEIVDSVWVVKEAHRAFGQLRQTDRGYL